MANEIITINFVEETIRVNIQGGATYTYAPSGDMLKSVYDIDNDGKVDLSNDSEKLGGYDANEYQLISEMPTIPTKLSDLTKDINFDERYYTETETDSLLNNKVTKNSNIAGGTFTKITYDAKGLVTSGSNILASDLPAGIDATKIGTGVISNTEFGYLNNVSSNIQSQIASKQATLISGTNIKTVNNQTLLGSGNINVSGGDVSNLVPYNGAIQNVNLGTYELTTDGIQLDLTNDTVSAQGKLYWNANDLTANLGLSDNVNLQIGQEYVYRVKADVNIANGQPVFASGSTGNSGRINVFLQTADLTKDSKYFLGLATENLAATEEGFITAFGLVRDVLISDVQQSGETWLVGDVLYVSATESGKLTKTKPTAPNLHISTAMVLFINGAETHVTFFVRPLHGLKLNDIHDLYTNGKSNNDVLIWNNSNSRWENSALKTINTLSLVGSGNINLNDYYYTETETDTLLSGKSDTSHNHTLASLTEKSYYSLTDKPTIPTALSQLSKDINFDDRYYTESEIDTKIGDIETLLAAL